MYFKIFEALVDERGSFVPSIRERQIATAIKKSQLNLLKSFSIHSFQMPLTYPDYWHRGQYPSILLH